MEEPSFLERRIRELERFAAKAFGIHFLTMEEVDGLVSNVVSQVVESGYKPECVVGILNAGYYPGKKIAEALNVEYIVTRISRNDIYCMGVKMNDRLILNKIASSNKAYTLQVNNFFPRTGYNRFLIIDDDCVSGETLDRAEEEIRDKNDVEEVKKGVLMIGENCYEPDYIGERQLPINRFIKGSKRFPWVPFSPYCEEYHEIAEDMFWKSVEWEH